MREAHERGNNDFLKWRKLKKECMMAYAKNGTDGKEALRDWMLFTQRNLSSIEEDKGLIDSWDNHREGDSRTERFK